MLTVLKAAEQIATKRLIKKRSIVFYQGEIPRSACVVKEGLLKVYSINSAGEEQIVTFHTPGDIFPVPWVFNEASSTLFYYEAITDCEVLYLPKDKLVHAIENDPVIFKEVFRHFTNVHTGLMLRVTALEQSRALEKILFTLYFLLYHYGKEQKSGIYKIELKLTQPIIAGLVGLTRETTAKNLNQLKRRGIVSYDEYEYIVNKPELERFLGEDSFKDLVS